MDLLLALRTRAIFFTRLRYAERECRLERLPAFLSRFLDVPELVRHGDVQRRVRHLDTAAQRSGHEAYLVGGCVRDLLIVRSPKDFDVATNAEPDRLAELFTTSHAEGEAFGVQLVAVREGRQRVVVEVATFRTEWGYADGRRPTSIRFTDARHDAARRDFTINGLFEDPLARSGQDPIIDFVEGRADLARGIVRAIGALQVQIAKSAGWCNQQAGRIIGGCLGPAKKAVRGAVAVGETVSSLPPKQEKPWAARQRGRCARSSPITVYLWARCWARATLR